MELPKLDEPCPMCGGKNTSDWIEPCRCGGMGFVLTPEGGIEPCRCGGTGFVLTPEGEKLLEFLKRHVHGLVTIE